VSSQYWPEWPDGHFPIVRMNQLELVFRVKLDRVDIYRILGCWRCLAGMRRLCSRGSFALICCRCLDGRRCSLCSLERWKSKVIKRWKELQK